MAQLTDNTSLVTKLALNVRPLRLAYFVLEDDRQAFERVVRYTCTQWGGIRNLIIPVPPDATLWPVCEQFLSFHPPDRFVSYLPKDVDGTALVSRLQRMFPGVAVRLLNGPDYEVRDHSVHPLAVLPHESLPSTHTTRSPQIQDKPALVTHALPESDKERLPLLTIFGTPYAGQEADYEKAFTMRQVEVGRQDAQAYWRHQHDQTFYGSVLNLTGQNVQTRTVVSPTANVAFHLVVTDTVPGLCGFWNFRALRDATDFFMPEGRRTFLLPSQWVTEPQMVEALCKFIRSAPAVPDASSDLDLIVTCTDDATQWAFVQQLTAVRNVEILESASSDPDADKDVPLIQLPGGASVRRTVIRASHGFGNCVPREADPNRTLTCAFGRPHVCHTFTEGSGKPGLPDRVSLDRGRNEIRLEPPDGFRNKGNGQATIDLLCDVWKQFPRDPAVAQLVHQFAWFSHYGLSIEHPMSERPHDLTINLPAAWEALSVYFSKRGYEASLSPPGQYGNALLDLVGGLRGAELFASTLAYRLLDALSVRSSKKVAQRIIKELKLSEAVEGDLVRLLRDADIVPELKKVPKTLQELCCLAPKRELLQLLGRLAEMTVVKRGFHATCPACQTPSWFPLHGVQESLTCPGCSGAFLLPVEYPQGSGAELGWEYTLNSLVNRIMDQDVLPAILALYHETKPSCDLFCVPGLELVPVGKSDVEVEFDFLFVRDQELFAGECKAGTELYEKDVKTGRLAADLGVKEFSFCTLRKFSETAMGLVEKLRSELKERSLGMTVKVLSGDKLLGVAL